MIGTVQGSDAVMSFYKDTWVPFMCATDISISMTADVLPVRTVGRGHWKNITYQTATFAVNLSGLMVFDAINWTTWDISDNWLNFTPVQFRCSFSDSNGDTRSVQGFGIVTTNTLSITTSALVKTDFNLQGTGELMIFDGLVPCPSSILTITAVEAGDGSGNTTFTYTYNGAPYQIKYQIDGAGNFIYVLLGTSFTANGVAIGTHSINIIPVCQNNYEGSGLIQSFSTNHGLVCSAVITDITITSTSATPVYTGTPAYYYFIIDSGPQIQRTIGQSVPLSGLSVGSHSINMVPECANGIYGTGTTKIFSVATQPGQSIIDWTTTIAGSTTFFNIFVNGVLTVSTPVSGSGSITVPTGATVLGRITNTGGGSQIITQDDTLSTTLDNRNTSLAGTIQYTFVTNGDTYSITATNEV